MLPILRIVPVGGVLLAILILVLALTPPDRTHLSLSPTVVMARGPLLDRDEHPEWRQFLIHAALRRADELNRLRELPDTPVRIGPVAPVTETRAEPTPTPSEPVSADSAKLELPQAANAEPEIPQPTAAQPAIAEPTATPADAPENAPRLFAGLPADRSGTDPNPDDVTGSINESPGATIPIDIGETSSTELPVVLPKERPPVIRTPERAKPAHESRRKRVHRVRHVKVEPQPPPPLGFFEMLFGAAKTQPPPAPVTVPTSAQRTPRAAKPAPQARAAAN